MRQSINIIFEDYYLKFQGLKNNEYVVGYLVDRDVYLEGKN